MHLKDKISIAFTVYVVSAHGFPENQALDLDITVLCCSSNVSFFTKTNILMSCIEHVRLSERKTADMQTALILSKIFPRGMPRFMKFFI